MNAAATFTADDVQALDTAQMDARARTVALEGLLTLLDLNIRIVEARTFGSGSRATVEIELSNGETMVFEQLRDMTNAGQLAAELVACTGATPMLKKADALEAVSHLRAIANHHKTTTDNDAAVEWGSSFLQAATFLDFDLDDQASRWEAFSALAEADNTRDPIGTPPPMLVLRHADGTRLVRSSWFVGHVKRMEAAASQREISTRMIRVGWVRRGREGRVKATRPSLGGSLTFAFHFVPDGWEER